MNGTYGTIKPAYIDSSDCDIYYNYRPSRSVDSSDFPAFKQLERSLITSCEFSDNSVANKITRLPGMYNLKLPLDQFSTPGIYTVYIKPREIFGQILDVSTLSAFPNVRGIVIASTDFDSQLPDSANGLVGYRVEYFENNERTDIYRIITSSNRCEPVAQNMDSSVQKGVRYMFNESSNLWFCTLTPSTEMSFKANSNPYIGQATQKIALINTKFNPVCLEIEMVEHDIETVSTMLEGNQIRNLDAGLITTFNNDGEIYHQASYSNIANPSEGIHHDVKINNTDVVNTEERENYNKILRAL